MIAEDFIYKLSTKFKDKKDDARNDIFKDDLIMFVNACPENHLQDVYQWITLNHRYSTPFLLSKINDYANKKGYIEKRATKQDPYWNVCGKCGAKYSKMGRGCPKCRCAKAEIHTGEYLPDNLIFVQEDCFYCTIYPESIKKSNERKLYFTGCVEYGKKQDPKCSCCQCEECCKQMMIYNADPVGTVEKYKTTELAQPWLYEVDPLNETVKKMVKDIAKRGIK